MKKNLIFTAALFAALSFGFASCENPDDNEELLNRIEQLENQLKDQQSGKDDDKTDSADKDGDKDTSSDNEQNGDDAPDSGDDDSDTPSAGIGTFSVAADKQVIFSKGNLQYTRSTNTWSFAANQWECVGTDNVTGGEVEYDATYGYSREGTALADKVDLFGWSTSATNFGVSTSTSNSDYSGSFVDWGTNQIGADVPNTWRTLTYDEWYYLRYERPNYDELIGVAQVNGVNGLVLLPDSWTCPEGITFKSGFHSNYGVDYYAAYQTFTADQWSKMEQAGAVFLPAAGFRYGSDVYGVQSYGYYWSATEYDGYNAYYLNFGSDEAGMYDNYRYIGHSVRLAKDL